MERSIRDQWNLEIEHSGSLSDGETTSIRCLLLIYLCAQSVVAIGLFNFGKIGWIVFLFLVYSANQLYALKVSRFVEPLSEKARESEKTLYVLGGVTLIFFLFLPTVLIGWESPTINWLAFGFFNYAAFVSCRGLLLWSSDGLDQYFHVKKNMYERLATHGYLNPWCLESVWYQVCTSHAGQGCVLGTRIFVPQESKAKVLVAMAAMMQNIKIGPASDPATQLGPVISAAQRDRCDHFTNAAVAAGGRVVTGGKRPAGLDKGFYWEPTVLDLPDNKNPAAQEEIFGPVVGVIGYRDLDHAVEMANDSKFGLSGWVHGVDKVASLNVGMRIRSGSVNVNGALMSSYASGGGIRMSGLGRERGVEGLR